MIVGTLDIHFSAKILIKNLVMQTTSCINRKFIYKPIGFHFCAILYRKYYSEII
jgi:hypothetical protein